MCELCPLLWKGEGVLKEPIHSLSPPTKPEVEAEQKAEGGRAPACGSWRWMLGLLPFFPFTAAIALTLHFLSSPPSSVFFLGGSVEFPNLSFSLELSDSTSPQFRLQAQALNHYVSGIMNLSLTLKVQNLSCQYNLTPPPPVIRTAALIIWCKRMDRGEVDYVAGAV